jgi:hypothetical protein
MSASTWVDLLRGVSVLIPPARPAFLRFLFPPWLDASENLTGLLDVAICPESDLYSSDPSERRGLDGSGRDVPLKGNEIDA